MKTDLTDLIAALRPFRLAGYAVVVFTPDEISDSSLSCRRFEEALVEKGNEILAANLKEDDE